MNRIICDSGLEGWQQSLRENYDNNFEQFASYCETYDIHHTLGFFTPEEAWNDNPVIQGSVNPCDFRCSDNRVNEYQKTFAEVSSSLMG